MRPLLATLVVALLALPASASALPIATGEGQTCEIGAGGAALCWGARSFGSLGDGLSSGDTYDKVQVSGLGSGVTQIVSSQQGGGASAGVCAIVNGGAKCWGMGTNGKLGDGKDSPYSLVPVDVAGLGSGVTDISTSAGRACAVHNGAAKCWGGKHLGNGVNSNSAAPVQVQGMTSNVTQVSNGWRHTCAVQAGVVSCWGGGEHGSLGSPGGESALPRPVAAIGQATAVAAGADSACAIYGGAVRCWGSNSSGQLGNGTDIDETPNPVNVVGLDSGVTAISHNWFTGCAIKNALLYCWGLGQYGMLGNGGTANSNVPVQVPGLGDVTAVATSNTHTCALANGGVLYCWGANNHGQLGNEGVGGQSLTPVTFTGSLPKPVATPAPKPPVTTQPAPKPAATISTLAGRRKVSKQRTVTIATVTCPAGASCAIRVPKTVKVKIARKTYTATVSVSKLKVGLKLPKTAYKKLKGRSANVTVKVSATATGASTTTLTVKATIKR